MPQCSNHAHMAARLKTAHPHPHPPNAHPPADGPHPKPSPAANPHFLPLHLVRRLGQQQRVAQPSVCIHRRGVAGDALERVQQQHSS